VIGLAHSLCSGSGTGYRSLNHDKAGGESAAELVVQQRLYGSMPEHSLGVEVLTLISGFSHCAFVGSPQALQCWFLDRYRCELVGPFGSGA
jgi:hypothetical protein